MLSLIHRIRIINASGDVFTISNVNGLENNFIGLNSVQINKTKGDILAECVIGLSSKVDNIVLENFGKDFLLNYALPLPTNEIGKDEFDKFDYFNFSNEDLIYIELAYNENEKDNKEIFFGFIKSVNVDNKKNIQITIHNHAFFLKKILYNFSEKSIKIKDLLKKIVDDSNSKIKDYYSKHLNGIKDANFKKIINNFLQIIWIKEIINVDYEIFNFRASNSTALDVFEFIKSNYLTKTNFIYLPTGETIIVSGLLNVLTVFEDKDINQSYKEWFGKDFLFKIYNLEYETFGLNDNYIIQEANKVSSIDNPQLYITKSNQLKWKNSSDVNIKVNIKVINKNNEVTEKSYGDENGETTDLVFYEEKTDKQLKEFATEIIKQSKYTGYDRSSTITSFGDCNIDLFQNFFVIDVFKNKDKDAKQFNLLIQKYLVDSISISYTSSGFEKVINFGLLLNTNIKEKVDSKIEIKLQGDGEFIKTEKI